MEYRVQRRVVGAVDTVVREIRLIFTGRNESSGRRSGTQGSRPPHATLAAPRKEPDTITDDRRVASQERRDVTSRGALVERFRAEFREMPGLWVTQSEARCLFGVPEDICQRVLDALVDEGTLSRTSGGVYRTPPAIGGRHD